MVAPLCQAMGFGITCIDAMYVKPGVACLYLLEQGDDCAIVETGTCLSIPYLRMVLKDRGITPAQVRYVIPTHVHLDHAGGAGAMLQAFPKAELLVHPRGSRHLIDPGRLVTGAKQVYGKALFDELYGPIQPAEADRVREMEDGDSISFAGRDLVFRHTRGHAEHHFCIWDEKSSGWFSGDMFGVSYPWCRGIGEDFVFPSTTPNQFDPEAFVVSLRLLDSYQPKRMYMTHFGALSYQDGKAQLLLEQLESHCDLAVAYGEDRDYLQERLMSSTIERLREIDPDGDEQLWRSELGFDMQLNALGLQDWLQRVAR
ncbi:MAG: MBL fold metallo-hydrolase [Halioglobus sp.]|nr:MBL fold metallo-hydrolase [Halioglobus sp.]